MSRLTTTEIGRRAEAAASVYLEMRGFKILERNWRRPRCEIDIIARKDDVIHFIEVKYRVSSNQGSGLEAITQSKLKQMQRSAWYWTDEYKYNGNYVLSAIELTGSNFSVLGFVENIY